MIEIAVEAGRKETNYIRESIKNDLKAKGLLGIRENGEKGLLWEG